MGKFLNWGSKGALVSAAAGALLGGTAGASAAENISGDVGIYYTSHFVSYGADVWGGGTGFFGDRATSSIYGDVALKLSDSVTVSLNAWTDINNNVPSGIGGHLQELDINPGISYTTGKFTFGLTYGAWTYGGDVEEVIDTSVAYNDTGLLMPDFALNPKVVWHYRTSGNNGQNIGSAIVLSVGPSFPLGSGFSLTIPAGIAFFTTSDFQFGNSSGYGFSYFGGSLGYALGFVPAAYGAWSVNFDLIGYFTRKAALPGNVAENFLTGTVGLKVAF